MTQPEKRAFGPEVERPDRTCRLVKCKGCGKDVVRRQDSGAFAHVHSGLMICQEPWIR